MRIAEYTLCIIAGFFHYGELARGAALFKDPSRTADGFSRNSSKIGAANERLDTAPTLAETAELLHVLRDTQRQQRFGSSQQQMVFMPLDPLTASQLLHNTVEDRSESNPDIYQQLYEENFQQQQQQQPQQQQQMPSKRAQTFVRFGKRGQTFVRFGKRAQTFVRFG